MGEIWTTEPDEAETDFELIDTEPTMGEPDTTNSSDSSRSFVLVRYICGFIMHLRKEYYLSDILSQQLLLFFRILFGILGSLCKCIANLLPSSFYKMNQSPHYRFKRYVVCKKCHHIYFFDDCVHVEGGRKISKPCPFIAFPHHPHRRRRLPCSALLLKHVEVASGKTMLYPFMSYCYLSLEVQLQAFLLRPNFYSQCEQWRSKTGTDLSDVMDGRIWKEFQTHASGPFLSQPWNLALMMNVDWFQPFKHVQYSVGVIYLTIMNLPRHLRFKRENMITVGIIPGPHEPSENINSFLEPLVNELTLLWQGKELPIHGTSIKQKVRCALLCVSCDLPAGRKVCGFKSYNSRHGCSKCLKSFPGTVGCMDYSGFDRVQWIPRTYESHQLSASKILSCTTKADILRAEGEYGYRYTLLLKLPYFHPSRMLVIDPMHNIFLGSGKYILKHIWLQRNLIEQSQYNMIQNRMDRMKVPSDMGRIPYKITSGFSSFTADQFKNWILYFSVLALRDVLAEEHLQCWQHFVLACRKLCRRRVTLLDIQIGDALLMQFCTRYERIYGKDVVTPNMHLHAHLRDCLLDYGPFYGFWCFSYERFNGILGQMPNNNRSIELQLMKRFAGDMEQFCATLPQEYTTQFASVFTRRQVVGSVSETLQESVHCATVTLPDLQCNWGMAQLKNIQLPTCFSRGVLSNSETDGLKIFFARLYSVSLADVNVNSVTYKFKEITFNGKIIGSKGSRSSNSSVVMASWFPNLLCVDDISNQDTRPARINYFMKHVVLIRNTPITHVMFSVSWFKSRQERFHYGKPISIWECDIFEDDPCTSFLPIQLIVGRTVSLVDKLNFGACESVLLVCPCID